MRNTLIMLLMSIVAFASDAQSLPIKQKLAVYMIGDVDDSYKKVIGSKMVSEIAKSPDYMAIERTADFLSAITTEQDYQVSGNVSDSQIAKIGQQFGVRYVAVVDANELLDEIFVSSRLIDVQSGVIVYSYDTSSPVQDMNQLVILSQNVAKGLIINPKEEERARIKAEQERVEQENRERIERAEREERQRKEEAARRENERRQQLRSQTINNLVSGLGVDVFFAGNYIIMKKMVVVRFEFDPSTNKVVQKTKIPQGWNMADEMVLRSMVNRGYDLSVPGLCFVCPDSWPVPDKSQKFNTSKMLGYWQIHCWHGNSLYCRRTTFGETVKQKGSSIPVFERSISYTVATYFYRPMFSESEIQQEINRIK